MPEQFHIFKLEGLRFKLKHWYETMPVKVSDLLLNHIRDELLRKYKSEKWLPAIDNLKLRHGVLCDCGQEMTYRYGIFRCNCGKRSRDGFLKGLLDYRLLCDEWITNRAFREFLKIDDVSIVSKYLQRLNLKFEGEKKARKYYIPENILEIRGGNKIVR